MRANELKNDLESYVYDARGKLNDNYKDYASEAEKTNILAKLKENEEWVYGAGAKS